MTLEASEIKEIVLDLQRLGIKPPPGGFVLTRFKDGSPKDILSTWKGGYMWEIALCERRVCTLGTMDLTYKASFPKAAQVAAGIGCIYKD